MIVANGPRRILSTYPKGLLFLTVRSISILSALRYKKECQEAWRVYDAPVAIARSEEGSHATTWKPACWLMAKLNPSANARGLI
jgi:hypothetical protein